MRNRSRIAAFGAAGVAVAIGATALASSASASAHEPPPAPKPSVVLVNGAWSNQASWTSVAARLRHEGYPVVAPPTGLRSLSDDSAYLASYLKGIKGPIVLVGQSYGGSVITEAAAHNPHVKALVYISAFAPAKGESAASLTAKFPGTHITTDPTPGALPTTLSPVPFTLANGSSGLDLYEKAENYRDVFLSNQVSKNTAADLAATQSPITLQALGDKLSGPPAWKKIPSWFLVSKDDHLIPPKTERFMAARAHAHTVEANTPHAAQVTNPGIVTNLIERAAKTAH